MKVYDKPWNEIARKDWPMVGEAYVCLDPQKTLGEETWSVSILGDGSLNGDTLQLGLFWGKETAIFVAEQITISFWVSRIKESFGHINRDLPSSIIEFYDTVTGRKP